MTGLSRLVTPFWQREAWFLALGLGAAYLVSRLLQQGNGRAIVAGSLLVLLSGVALAHPRAAIVCTLLLLSLLGIIRRALIPLVGWSSQDPILLVGPAVALLMVVVLLINRRVLLDTPLSRWVLLLMAVMTLEVVNPLQGGLPVGVAGMLFYLVPLLWFWIGRTYATPEFVEFVLYRLVIPLSVPAALLGIYQVFYGLLPFDQTWVDVAGYTALKIKGHIRPFSFFTSAAEYIYYLGITMVLLWAGWLKGVRTGLVLAPLLLLAVFTEGSRGLIVLTLFAGALLWTVQGESREIWLPRLVLSLTLGVMGLVWSLSQIQTIALPPGRLRTLITHQTAGLLRPLNPAYSTAPVHLGMLIDGIAQGFTNPLGRGLGATTLASQKFGGTGGGTEVDLSNMFVSLGAVGGIIYAVIVGLVLTGAVGYWIRTRSLLALAVLGLLVVMLGQWLNGGYYGASMLTWFCIGALDRFHRMEPDEAGHRHA